MAADAPQWLITGWVYITLKVNTLWRWMEGARLWQLCRWRHSLPASCLFSPMTRRECSALLLPVLLGLLGALRINWRRSEKKGWSRFAMALICTRVPLCSSRCYFQVFLQAAEETLTPNLFVFFFFFSFPYVDDPRSPEGPLADLPSSRRTRRQSRNGVSNGPRVRQQADKQPRGPSPLR